MHARRSEPTATRRETELLALLVNAELYGREIRQQYERRYPHRLSYGALYTTLDRMETKGFVRSRLSNASSERGGNRRKYFKISALGERALTATFVWHESVYRVAQIG